MQLLPIPCCKNIIKLQAIVILCFTSIQILQAQDAPVHTFGLHNYTVFSTGFSPDGKYVVTGSWDNTMKLWDVKTGKLIRTFIGHQFAVFGVDFSPDGKYLISSSKDNTIKLWNVKTGGLLRTFYGHKSWVYSVRFSPDGKYFASGSWDGSVKLWDMRTEKLITTFYGHTQGILTVRFSNNGKYIASGSEDRTIKLWDVETQKLAGTFYGHTNAVWSVDFSPNDQYLVSGSQDMTIKKWNIKNRQIVWTKEQPTGWVNSVKYYPKGNYIVSSSFEQFTIWRDNGDLFKAFSQDAGAIYSIAISPDGKKIVSSYKQSANLWDVSGVFGPPITWKQPQEQNHVSTTGKFSIEIYIESDTTIHYISVFLNDSLYIKDENIKLKSNTDKRTNYSKQIVLQAGTNHVKIVASTPQGFTTTERTIVYPMLKPERKTPDKRLALLIGNSNYLQTDSIPQARQNVDSLAGVLQNAGFHVLYYKDVAKHKTIELLRQFANKRTENDIALFYYSGYAIQHNSTNYLIPVDAPFQPGRISTGNFIKINDIFQQSQLDNKLTIGILEASHVSPFEKSLHNYKQGRGLCYMPVAQNSIVAYAAQPGTVSVSPESDLDIYTQTFIEQLLIPGYSLTEILQNTRDIVVKRTKQSNQKIQIPLEITTLKRKLILLDN